MYSDNLPYFNEEKGDYLTQMKKLFIIFLSVLMTLCAIAPIYADDEYSVKVSAPNGAPALAVATLAAEDPDSYTFVAADTIAAEFAN